jgi:hypothetical protein
MATTTPNYGWDVPTSSDYVKLGAVAIETLGDDIDATLWTALGGNYPGLRLIKTQVIGSAVSSVTVTGAFSATFPNYCIVMSNTIGTASNAMRMSYNNSTGSTYSHVGSYWTFGSTSLLTETGSSLTSTWIGNVHIGSTNIIVDVFSPFLSAATHSIGRGVGPNNPTLRFGQDTATASNTGFTITPGAGTLTGGTIYVYGYGAS